VLLRFRPVDWRKPHRILDVGLLPSGCGGSARLRASRYSKSTNAALRQSGRFARMPDWPPRHRVTSDRRSIVRRRPSPRLHRCDVTLPLAATSASKARLPSLRGSQAISIITEGGNDVASGIGINTKVVLQITTTRRRQLLVASSGVCQPRMYPLFKISHHGYDRCTPAAECLVGKDQWRWRRWKIGPAFLRDHRDTGNHKQHASYDRDPRCDRAQSDEEHEGFPESSAYRRLFVAG